jgi:hypothetical protein
LVGLDNPPIPLPLPSLLFSSLPHCRRQLNIIVNVCIGNNLQCLCPLPFQQQWLSSKPCCPTPTTSHTTNRCCPPHLIAPPPLATSLLSSGWLLCCLLLHHCLPSAGASAPPRIVSAGASASHFPVLLPLVVPFWLVFGCCAPLVSPAPAMPPLPGQQRDNKGDEGGLSLSLLLLVHHHHQLLTPAISSARLWLPPLKTPVAYAALVVVHPQLVPFICTDWLLHHILLRPLPLPSSCPLVLSSLQPLKVLLPLDAPLRPPPDCHLFAWPGCCIAFSHATAAAAATAQWQRSSNNGSSAAAAQWQQQHGGGGGSVAAAWQQRGGSMASVVVAARREAQRQRVGSGGSGSSLVAA